MDAYQRLTDWFEPQDMTKARLARQLGCTPHHVALILARKRRPGLGLAFAIEKATKGWEKGPILASEWLSVEVAA